MLHAHGRTFAAAVISLVFSFASAASEPPRYPPGSDVPPPGSAFILPHAPQARMIDGTTTCELIAGLRARNGDVLAGGVHLFRWGQHEPFMHVATREDGLLVAHFEARPNETVIGAAYHWHPRSRRAMWMPRQRTTCRAGRVQAGALEPTT